MNDISPTNPRILIVDDEPAIAELVAETLSHAGMEPLTCTEASRALDLIEGGQFDLVMLDVMMPGIDGFCLCARIRTTSRIPVIFLSAKDEEADKVVGLTCGADDYVTKPFMPRELVARVRSCLRRSSYQQQPSHDVLTCRGIELDVGAHVARLHDSVLTLTPKEFTMLELLLRANGRPIATKELYERVWGEAFLPASANSVMVHIRHLRAKLSALDAEQRFIETVWGVGYKIVP